MSSFSCEQRLHDRLPGDRIPTERLPVDQLPGDQLLAAGLPVDQLPGERLPDDVPRAGVLFRGISSPAGLVSACLVVLALLMIVQR